MWQACTDGDLDTVVSLSGEPGVNVDWKDAEYERTPFYRACFFGKTEVVEFLLRHPRVNVNDQQKEGATPLNVACQNGHYDVVALLLADPRILVHVVDNQTRTPFFIACLYNHSRVVALLLTDPRVDPCLGRSTGATPFHIACQDGYLEIISLLLADRRVEVSRSEADGATPFYMLCQNGHHEGALLLLDDPRVNINQPRSDNSSPLWFATQNGHLMVVKLLLASGREVLTQTKSNFNQRTAVMQGRRVVMPIQGEDAAITNLKFINGPLCADLIEEYDRDPAATSSRLRRLPEIRDNYIGRLFALVVFLTDNFVALKPETPNHVIRFLGISQRLPLELQMVLCNRVFGSGKNLVLIRHSEPGFRWLGRPTTVWD